MRVLACLILRSGSVLAAAMACGNDPVVGGNVGGAALGSGNSGGTEMAVGGAENAAGSGNGGAGNPTSAGGAENAAGTGNGDAGDAAGAGGGPEQDPLTQFASGQSSEACGWSLASEVTGAACTPGEVLQLGCCDCQEDAILRICDGSMACSDSAALGFNDDSLTCGPKSLCPQVQFTCPASGVVSAMTGTYPYPTEDGSSFLPPLGTCQPTLGNASGSGGSGSDAGSASDSDAGGASGSDADGI